ncbi:MAG TPA: NAD(P)-dependent oxidoreductase [Abditibacteriaceae bacterium]|nr:NAD(P)-dependent oxidoreductase [Abditibacteriaceae bacterium]
MKLLVTGGTGFCGCHVARRFLDEGWTVRLFDMLPLDEPDLKHEVKSGRVEVVQGDIRDADAVRAAAQGVDAIVHTAAALPIQGSRDTIMDTNVGGTRNTLNAALNNGVGKALHISTTAVYGVPKIHPLYETSPIVPLGLYGISKVDAEKECDAARGKGLDVTIIRPKTFIGTGRLGIFQILFEWIREGCKIPIIGTGNNRYQLLAVSDLVDALYRSATQPNHNETFNIGAKRYGTVRQDLGALLRHARSGSRLVPMPPWLVQPLLRVLEIAKLSPLVEWHYKTANQDSFVDCSHAERVLGWQAQKSNAETLMETYDWYLNHYEEYLHTVGLTHRTAWDQGALKILQRLMGGGKA